MAAKRTLHLVYKNLRLSRSLLATAIQHPHPCITNMAVKKWGIKIEIFHYCYCFSVSKIKSPCGWQGLLCLYNFKNLKFDNSVPCGMFPHKVACMTNIKIHFLSCFERQTSELFLTYTILEIKINILKALF